MKIKLTAANVRTLQPDPSKKDGDIFWDTALPSFGLRVRSSAGRGCVVRYERGSKQLTMTLGSVKLYKLTQARKAAKGVLAKVRLGQDPAGEKQKAQYSTSGNTFGGELPLYLKAKAKGTK